MPALDALTRWLIPRLRQGQPGWRAVAGGPVAGLAQRLGVELGGLPAEEVGLQIEYEANGRPIVEEFYGVKVSQTVPYYGPMGAMNQVNWGFARLIAFAAEKGAVDGLRDTFWRIASSLQVNPLWQQLYTQILQQLQQQFNQYIQAGYDQIAAAGQHSRTISAKNDAMLRGFEQQRQAAAQSSSAARRESLSSEGFSEYIRGVETMNDPYWGESQQDANYSYHWTDGSGNYQSSNDAFFNPNIGGTQNWTLMTPKRG
jgi:hypothetical protein